MPTIGRESLQAGRATKFRFECEVAGWRHHWYAVGYLFEDTEPPVYIEFRKRYEGSSREVEARWQARADTLQESPSAGDDET